MAADDVRDVLEGQDSHPYAVDQSQMWRTVYASL